MAGKEIFGYLSLAVGIFSNAMYLWSLIKRHSKPHAFSWGIWGLLTGIAFFAQYSQGAGPGAWATGFTAISCFFVAGWAATQGERDITLSDWITFIGALAILPVWYATRDPMIAVVLIVIIDALGFWPTFRKSWMKPYEEMISTYALGLVKFSFALAAMENYTPVTVTYPVFILLSSVIFVAMVMWRRRALQR